jgi:DNA-binding transcriptional LysR family regulator
MNIGKPSGHGTKDASTPGNASKALSPPNLYVVDPTLALTFSVAAQEGSFTRAALVLGINPSTVSRRLDGLEASLAVRLFERDTRNLSLSEAGQAYLAFVDQALNALEEGRYAMERHTTEVKGRLRVVCAPAIGRCLMAELVLAFNEQYPQVEVSLRLDGMQTAKTQPDYDVAISLGMPDDSRAVVSKLGEVSFGYLATPDFLAQRGKPANAKQLARLPLAGLAPDSSLHDLGVVVHLQDELASVALRFTTNDEQVLQQVLLSGHYAGRLMLLPCLEAMASARLVKLRPELDTFVTLYTVAPARKEKSLKAQLFIDFLKDKLARQIKSAEARLASISAKSATVRVAAKR